MWVLFSYRSSLSFRTTSFLLDQWRRRTDRLLQHKRFHERCQDPFLQGEIVGAASYVVKKKLCCVGTQKPAIFTSFTCF